VVEILAYLASLTIPVLQVHVEPEQWPGAALVQATAERVGHGRRVYALTTEDTPAGMHAVATRSPVVIATGGYFTACYANAIRALAENSGHGLVVIVPTRGVFVGDNRTLADALASNPQDAWGTVTRVLGPRVVRLGGCLVGVCGG
jgi:hypothetical protein